MKTFNTIGVLFVIMLTTSCITPERCARFYPPQITRIDSVKVTVKERVRDTVFEVSADSSWLKAWIECDSAGRASIRELIGYRSGLRAQTPRVSLRGNILTADCNCDSIAIHAILKDREKVVDHQSAVSITPPAVQVKFIPGWMWFFGITGMISWAGMVIMAIYFFIKSKFKLWI